MYEVVKRCGSFFEPIPDAPRFRDKADAESWAGKYIQENPHLFRRGLEAIEVRRKLDTLNEKFRQVDA